MSLGVGISNCLHIEFEGAVFSILRLLVVIYLMVPWWKLIFWPFYVRRGIFWGRCFAILATFLCRHLQIRVTEGLQIRRLHNHEVQIRTSRNSSTRRPIRHTHTDPSRFNFTAPSHHFYRYRRPLATCYNQRAEATAIILTAMHVHTSNCLLDWLITAQIATYDANMQRYASTHDEVEIIEWRRAASSNLATGCYMLLYSKPSNRRR